MYVKGGVVYKLINIELDMPEPVFMGMKLYQDIARRLIDHKITTSEPIINEYPGNDTIVSLVIHISNEENPENMRLVHVKKALDGLLDGYPCYTGMRITVS
jgi:hypothetical protein